MSVEIYLSMLLCVTTLLFLFVSYNTLVIGPRIGWDLTSQNTIISVLFLLQFCVYPWYSHLSNSQKLENHASGFGGDINTIMVLLLALFYYVLYTTLSISTQSIKLKIFTVGKKPPLSTSRLDALVRIYWFLYIIFLFNFSFFLTSMDGLSGFVEVLGSYRSGQISGTGIFTMPILILAPVLALYVIDRIKDCRAYTAKAFLISISVCAPPLLVGFRVYVAIFLFQLLYIYRTRINAHKGKFLLLGLCILIAFGFYSGVRDSLEASVFLDGSFSGEFNFLEPLFRSRSVDMIEMAIFCRCHSDNPFGLIIEPLNIYYKKLISEDYFSYSAQFTKDVLFKGSYAVNYGGVNPNFIGFYYWLLGGLGIIISLVIWWSTDLLLNSVRNVHVGFTNIFAAIVYSMIPVAFDAPTTALVVFFNQLVSLGLIWIFVSAKRVVIA